MIFKTAYFYKWQKKNKISDDILISAINEIQNGLLDADLGGFVLKKRIPKSNSGKSSGYRTILATAKDGHWFFMYGFSKNEQDNIDKVELKALQLLAKKLLFATNLAKALNNNEIIEVKHEKK
jgi:hypothetical protein